ncbi:MAG: M3 family metallopeptidase [Clostridia bacterium]|nr:M3 family metallopeptidase [Clostridia bacterium]
MKRLLAVLLTLAMCLSLAACTAQPDAAAEMAEIDRSEGKYPIFWNGAQLYADYDAWLADYESILDFPEKFEQFRGKLNTVDGLAGFLSLLYDEAYHDVYDKLMLFAEYGSGAFPSDPLYAKCLAKLSAYDQKYNNAIAYFDEELGALALEERTALFASEKLNRYAYQCRNYLNPKKKFFSEAENLMRNTLSISRGRMETLYSIFAFAQMPSVEYKLPNGSSISIDDTSLVSYLSDSSIDQKTKAQIYDAWWGHTAEYADTFAYILETAMLEQYANAQLEGYENTVSYALDSANIPLDVMDRILETAHEGAPRHAEYFRLYADRDGTEQYYSFAEYRPLSDYQSARTSYDDSVDQVTQALSILGDDYVENFMTIIRSGYVDVYPADGKSGGAFEFGGCLGATPFMMLNYNGLFDDAATIAHEGGHACYDLYAMQNQAYYNWGPGIFTHEVASTTNELLFYQYKIDHAASDEEKLFYLGSLLKMWTGTFFRQCFFQEFENYCHETVESGNALNPEEMTAKWNELSKLYYGDNYTTGEYGGYRWTTLDHLYYDHYVFKYATSVCYASAIAQAIISGEDGIIDRYKDFLKAGDSCSPEDALRIVGIDITDSEVYENGLQFFYRVLDEYETLAGK